MGDFAPYCAAIFALLVENDTSFTQKCEKIANILITLAAHEKMAFPVASLICLPSLVHLLHLAPKSQEREKLEAVISRMNHSDMATGLYQILMVDPSFPVSLAKTQQDLEDQWFFNRTQGNTSLYDASGATVGDWKAKRSVLDSPLDSVLFSPVSPQIDQFIRLTLEELRRLTILCELQVSDTRQPSWIPISGSTPALPSSTDKSPSASTSPPIPVCFDGNILSSPSPELKLAIPLILASMTHNGPSSSSSMDIDGAQRNAKGTDTQNLLNLPHDVSKLVISLLQNEDGDTLSYFVIMNMFLHQHPSESTHLPKSRLSITTKVIERLCLDLVNYLHLLRLNDPDRDFLPSTHVIGPFYNAPPAGHTNEKSTDKLISTVFFESGFPRRLSSLHHSLPSYSDTISVSDQIFALDRRDGMVKAAEELCSESEVQVAQRVESLLTYLVQNILIGPGKFVKKVGLDKVAQQLQSRLEKFFLCPSLQAQLALPTLHLYNATFQPTATEWLRGITSDQTALKRAFWSRFFKSNHPVSHTLIDRICAFDDASIANEGQTSPMKAATHLSHWFEVLCRCLAAFPIMTSPTMLTSITTAVSRLNTLQNLPGIEPIVDTAFRFAFCVIALLTLQPDQNGGERFSTFVSLFQMLTQLSNIESKYFSPSFALLRLFQQLHLLQRHDLVASTISHVIGSSVDANWLVRGLTTSVSVLVPSAPVSGPTPPLDGSPPDLMSRATSFTGENEAAKAHQVRMTDAWVWATSPALLAHLTLSTIHTWPLVSFPSVLPVSLVTVFEEEDFFPNLAPLLQKVSRHSSSPDSLSMMKLTTSFFSKAEEERPTWTARDDPWIGWLLLRLMLHINRHADFQRIHHTSSGGTYDGVADCLWKLCQQTGHFTCALLPLMTLPIHSIVIETLQTFVDLVAEGDQKFWALERIKLLFLPSHAVNFTQCLVVPCPNLSGIGTASEQVICPITPDNVLQMLVFVTVAFLKSPLVRSPLITPSTTPMVPTGSLDLDDLENPKSNTMDVDNEPEKVLLKKSDFLTYMARHYRISSPMIFLMNVPSTERKRQHLTLMNAVRMDECVCSPSKLLQLCKVLHIESIIPPEKHASGKHLFDSLGEMPRKCLSSFELVRKRVMTSFAHLRHFIDLLGTHTQKSTCTVQHLHPIPLNFDFLGSDYRALVNDHPFLANINFPSLHSPHVLDLFIFDSLQRLLSPASTHWEAQRLENIVFWSFRFVSLERTLQALALGMLHSPTQTTISQNNISTVVDSLHLKLIENPTALFGFNLRLLTYPSLFNRLFYKLISFYFTLSKAEIASVMRETEVDQTSSNLDDSEHSDDDSPRSKEDDDTRNSNGSLDRSTTKSSTTSGGTSPLDDDDSSKSESSSVVAALTDPFSLRRIPKNRRRRTGGGNLRGEQKVTSDDIESLKRLQDCALVQCLIDMLLLVEDDQIEKGHSMAQGAKEEIRVGICLFLQSLFVNDAPLMSLVHQQGYPARALTWLMKGVPAMHYCLELAPQLLARVFQRFTATDSDVKSMAFPIKLASHTIKCYPTQRSLDLANYILGLYKSCWNSLNASLWASTLPDLATIVLTFPTLTASLMELIILMEGSASSSKSIALSTGGAKSPQQMEVLRPMDLSDHYAREGFSARDVLQKVFGELVQGDSVAPFLRG